MAQRVARARRRGKPRPKARAERREHQQRVERTVRTALEQVLTATLEQALADEITAVVGRPRYARRRTAPAQRTGAACSRCGQDWAARLQRGGFYPRTLLTTLGAVRLQVPRVSCVCGGTVPLAFATFGRYERVWGDLQERARHLAGLCLSLRDIREVVAIETGERLAWSTVGPWVHEAAALAAVLRGESLERVPPVVLLDGVWVKVMVETGERYRDRQGRNRPRVRRERVPLLVALGVDPQTGERWVLDWTVGREEDEASWRQLLERLHARGLHAAAGLVLFVHDGSSGLEAAFGLLDFGPGVLRQRCIFHVLRTVRDQVHGARGMSREQRRAHRRQVLQEAAAIWQGTDPTRIHERYRQFCQQWRAAEPEAVAALERGFGATLAYLDARDRGREWGQEWAVAHLRTTSVLERVNRALRQKARQVGVFRSARGLQAAIILVLVHRGLTAWGAPTDCWTEVLEAGLLAA
jgi:transposase-like protein